MTIDLNIGMRTLGALITTMIWGEEGDTLREDIRDELQAAIPLESGPYFAITTYLERAYAAHDRPDYDLPLPFAERLAEAAHMVASKRFGANPSRADEIKLRVLSDIEYDPPRPPPLTEPVTPPEA